MAAIELPDDAELSEVALPYWEAWQALTTDRPFGALGGAGRIPFRSISQFANEVWGDPDEVDRLARMCGAMDTVFLEFLDEQQKRQQADKQQP